MVGSLLAMQPRYPLPEESDIMNDWTDAIDTIIDNLQPESVSKEQGRTATLHSAVTKETAVLHAAQDEDADAVLVVNEENNSTKYRMFMDASSRPSMKEYSLNQTLLKGPNMTRNLAKCMIRFRLGKFHYLFLPEAS